MGLQVPYLTTKLPNDADSFLFSKSLGASEASHGLLCLFWDSTHLTCRKLALLINMLFPVQLQHVLYQPKHTQKSNYFITSTHDHNIPLLWAVFSRKSYSNYFHLSSQITLDDVKLLMQGSLALNSNGKL